MRKAAGIILITLGVLFLYYPISIVVEFGISIFLVPVYYITPSLFAVILLVLVILAAFLITGGIFCLRRKYWRVCLASASFAVFLLVFYFVSFLVLHQFLWGSSWSDYISTGWPIWVMLVAEVIAVIFILRTKKEWQEISA